MLVNVSLGLFNTVRLHFRHVAIVLIIHSVSRWESRGLPMLSDMSGCVLSGQLLSHHIELV